MNLPKVDNLQKIYKFEEKAPKTRNTTLLKRDNFLKKYNSMNWNKSKRVESKLIGIFTHYPKKIFVIGENSF